MACSHFLFYMPLSIIVENILYTNCRKYYEGNEHPSLWNDYTSFACYRLTKLINLVVSLPLG